MAPKLKEMEVSFETPSSLLGVPLPKLSWKGRLAPDETQQRLAWGLYVELTTLKQSLVRKKNRKLRWMRQLYPEVRVKLFYARDFRALMLKYGRLDFLTDVAAANRAHAVTGAGREAAL